MCESEAVRVTGEGEGRSLTANEGENFNPAHRLFIRTLFLKKGERIQGIKIIL